MYERQCERLKDLDDRGAESSKTEAAQATIRKLLTKINVSVRAIDSISSRIHKLRDDELQPQLKELIYGYKLISFAIYAIRYVVMDYALSLGAFGSVCVTELFFSPLG